MDMGMVLVACRHFAKGTGRCIGFGRALGLFFCFEGERRAPQARLQIHMRNTTARHGFEGALMEDREDVRVIERSRAYISR